MSSYERLNRAIDGKREYERLRLKIEELEALATKVTPTLSDMPKGGGDHKVDDTWATLADYKSQCNWLLACYIQDCQQLEEELDCIRNTNIRTAMKYKYIDGYSVDTISALMRYDSRSVYRYLHAGRKIYGRYYEET